MSDLSPELRKLVLAGKSAGNPTSVDYDRVFSKLQARLGDAMIAKDDVGVPTASGSTASAISGKMLGITLAGVALMLGGIAWLILRDSADMPKTYPPVTDFEGGLTVSSVEVSSVPAPRPEVTTTTPSVEARSQPQLGNAEPGTQIKESSRSRDSLSDEVSILSRAETELHSGRAANAMKLLAEHERKYPTGILAEERTAARVQALCALGRTAEADAQLSRLRPGSLHGEQSRQACADSKTKASSSAKTAKSPTR
jgi:hypothetical protein